MTSSVTPAAPQPLVVAVDMGYGHMRAATPLARMLGTEVVQVDRPPLVGPEEVRTWTRLRNAYETVSRLSQVPIIGAPLRYALESVTDIPRLYPYRDLSAPTRGVRTLHKLIAKRGLGRALVERLRETGQPLLTTFYSPAIVADHHGLDRVFCVVTDTDLNRVWAPLDPRATRIQYLVPTARARRRLRSYGVPPERITETGFPLPDELLGGPGLPILKRNLAARLVRLDPKGEFRRSIPEELAHFLGALPVEEAGRPAHVVFAVGGAGAQAELAARFLPSMRRALEELRIQVTLVAGVRPEVEARFREIIRGARLEPLLGRGLEILRGDGFDDYYARFNAMLAGADVLWTKPSELAFYAALGIPLLFSKPVGVHERYNRRWVVEAGAGLKMRGLDSAGEWLTDWLADGLLASAAWSGYMRLPKFGLYRILEAVGASPHGRVGGGTAATRLGL
ncbi:MAG: hypothetical protein U0229_21380 [Anaeromyxobacter sp.]